MMAQDETVTLQCIFHAINKPYHPLHSKNEVFCFGSPFRLKCAKGSFNLNVEAASEGSFSFQVMPQNCKLVYMIELNDCIGLTLCEVLRNCMDN